MCVYIYIYMYFIYVSVIDIAIYRVLVWGHLLDTYTYIQKFSLVNTNTFVEMPGKPLQQIPFLQN